VVKTLVSLFPALFILISGFMSFGYPHSRLGFRIAHFDGLHHCKIHTITVWEKSRSFLANELTSSGPALNRLQPKPLGSGPNAVPPKAYLFSVMAGMARRAIPAREVPGGTNVRATLACEGVAPLNAARTSRRDVPIRLNTF
jgi:hypothetical protein